MYRTIEDFEFDWSMEIEKTQKIFKHLNDGALEHEVMPGYRTIGRLAWHIVQLIPAMASRTGLKISGPGEDDPVPTSARAILQAYNQVAISALDAIKSTWKDASLQAVDEMYGEKWKRGFTLTVLVHHQIHHRAQITVLMRQAGLEVPGIYGPAKPEWAQYGMPAPAI